jgi:peptidylprolyl isomerase
MISIRVLVILLISVLLGMSCKSTSETAATESADSTAVSTPEPPKALMARDGTPVPFSISDSSKIKKLANGLQIYVVKEGTGPKPQAGNKIIAHYHGMLKDGKVFDSSFERGESLDFNLGQKQVIDGWDIGFGELNEGSQAILMIPANLAYGAQGNGPVPPNSDLVFHVEFVKAINAKGMTKPPFNIADPNQIVTTPSGLQYYIVKKGTGPVPKSGQTIIAGYHGMLKDKTVFDSSYDRNDVFKTKIGVGQVIKGWDEAFTTLPVGSQAVLMIPPDLGYGAQGQGKIPANSTLIFHVELVEVL